MLANYPKCVDEAQETTTVIIARDENLLAGSPKKSKLFHENCFTSYSLVDNNPCYINQRYPIYSKNLRGNKKDDDSRISYDSRISLKSSKSKKLNRIQTQLKLNGC